MFKNRLIAFSISASVIMALVVIMSFITLDLSNAEKGKKYYKINKKNELERPEGYREWIFVGAPVTPNDMNDGKAPFPEFHNVYIDPVSYAHYKNTGKFREGTILVKELVSVGAKSASSGNGYFEGDFIGLEATIKDSKHFGKEPGSWAYFSFTNSDHSLPYKKTAAAFPAQACNSCHQATAADDWVFTQFYPVLRAAKPVK